IRIARTDIDRARGGGIVRSAGTQVFETPLGVGGPGAPLLNASNTVASGPSSIANTLAPIDLLESRQTGTSISTSSDPGGLPVPQFDGAITGRSSWFRRSGTTLGAGAEPLN